MVMQMHKIIALVFLLAISPAAACVNVVVSENTLKQAFLLAFQKDKQLSDLKLVDKNQYDDWGKKVIQKHGYSFVESFDLNNDHEDELFIAAYSKSQNKTYLLIFSHANILRLLKIESFSYPRLCIKKADDGSSLRAISVLGSETEGDVIWNGKEFQFIPYRPDY